jgi:ABC-type antimicrobial peptide transport system permease subunit
MQTDRGFDVRGLVTVSLSLDGATHQLGQRELPYFEETLARIRRLPHIRSVSATVFLPLYATTFVGGPFGLDGRAAKLNSMMVPVMSDYFRTMGGRLIRGREFTDAEVHSNARVAIVNDKFADEFGEPEEVLGHQLTIGNTRPRKIIGIVKAMQYETEGANSRQVFVPDHSLGGFFSTFVARVDGRAEDHLGMVRDTIRSVDSDVPVFGTKTMEQRLADTFTRQRFYSTAVLIFAGFALLLAVIGIYGVISYAVVQRSRELGVRMALGTTPVRLRGMLLRQGLVTIAAGAIPGLAGAWLSGRFLESLIEGAKSVDFATATCALLFIALMASTSIWIATRRINGLDIMAALRTE